MLGERGSFIKSIFFNPKVIIGLVLTFLTLVYEEGHIFDLFYEPKTYRNLAIGSAIYVCLFGLSYTDGMKKLDIGETLKNVIETMVVILLVWWGTLAIIVNYQLGGENYSSLLRKRFQQNGWIKSDEKVTDEIDEILKGVEAGNSYEVTPDENGNITVKVINN